MGNATLYVMVLEIFHWSDPELLWEMLLYT